MTEITAVANKTSGQTKVIRVLFFGAARDAVGQAATVVEVQLPMTAANAFAQIVSAFPALKRFGKSLLFAINEEYATSDREVQDGDEIAIFPPVSGGSSEISQTIATLNDQFDFFELTTEPIDVGEIARRVVLPECGATVTLDGYAREWTKGRQTLHLVYEAYTPMALREMRKLGRAAKEKFQIAYLGIVHRTGKLEIGETSVVISVGAPHRRAAFEACEWVIRELKRTVPIWKKEVFADGEVWVEGESGRSIDQRSG